jgi:hypothetical protein
MGAYADYEYYSGTYLGASIAAPDFPRLALRASAIVDRVTFGQAGPVVTAATDVDTIDKIKMATCAVAEEYQVLDKHESGGEIASERVGNNSVAYVQNKTAQLSDEAKMAKVAKTYLWPTGLMARNVDDNQEDQRYYDLWPLY